MEWLLSMGPKFNIPTNNKTTPIQTIIKDLEYGITISRVVDEDTRNSVRNNAVNKISNYYKKNNMEVDTTLNKYYIETRKFLKEHNDLWVLSADKGNSTVIMEKAGYFNAMNSLVEDCITYKK